MNRTGEHRDAVPADPVAEVLKVMLPVMQTAPERAGRRAALAAGIFRQFFDAKCCAGHHGHETLAILVQTHTEQWTWIDTLPPQPRWSGTATANSAMRT